MKQQFLCGNIEEDDKQWIEQLDLVSQLRALLDSAKILKVLKGALCNWPTLEKAGFMLKREKVNAAIKDLKDTRRHAIATLSGNDYDSVARAVLMDTRQVGAPKCGVENSSRHTEGNST